MSIITVWWSFFAVNSIDCETVPINEKTLEDLGPSGPKPILPYSSMFIFGQTNPWVLSSASSLHMVIRCYHTEPSQHPVNVSQCSSWVVFYFISVKKEHIACLTKSQSHGTDECWQAPVVYSILTLLECGKGQEQWSNSKYLLLFSWPLFPQGEAVVSLYCDSALFWDVHPGCHCDEQYCSGSRGPCLD